MTRGGVNIFHKPPLTPNQKLRQGRSPDSFHRERGKNVEGIPVPSLKAGVAAALNSRPRRRNSRFDSWSPSLRLKDDYLANHQLSAILQIKN